MDTAASSRRQFLGTAGGVALLGLSSAVGARVAAAAPTSPSSLTSSTGLVVDYLKQWMFDANHASHPLLSKRPFAASAGRNYNLKNLQTRRYLQWEKQTFGINLGWTDDATAATAKRVSRWFFTRPTSDGRPLRYGERLALGYGVSPSYVRYAPRTVGINLEWSRTPVFEWKLLGGPIGRPVPSARWVAVYNQRARDCLIHFDRTVGGDIGWPSSQTWTDQLGDILTQAVKDHWKEAVAALLTAAL